MSGQRLAAATSITEYCGIPRRPLKSSWTKTRASRESSREAAREKGRVHALLAQVIDEALWLLTKAEE